MVTEVAAIQCLRQWRFTGQRELNADKCRQT